MKYTSKTIALGIMIFLFLAFFDTFPFASARNVIFGNGLLLKPDSKSYFLYLVETPNIKPQKEATRADMPINTTATDKSISLYCNVPKGKYRVNSTLTVKYLVTNISSEAIYLITPKPKQVYFLIGAKDRNDSILDKDLYVVVKEFQIYDEAFDPPQLVRLAPGEQYTNNVRYKLKNYTPGARFSAYLSVFYLSEKGMAEINQTLSLPSTVNIGPYFRDREIKLTSPPIELSIIQ
jgi:hypothetical protein